MADPRFYDNCGPIALADVCAGAGIALPDDIDGTRKVFDLAPLECAGPDHLTYCSDRRAVDALARTRAGYCFVPLGTVLSDCGSTTVLLACNSVQHSFAAVATLFYPGHSLSTWSQEAHRNPSASLGSGVVLAPGVALGPGVDIGQGTRIGPNTVIGRGVAIGRNCEIGSNVSIANSYIGDGVVVLPGAQIGQPGFGFASSVGGHTKIPQLGRVIVQDSVEIGACSTIDRGALGDTVIGEGTKIDNLVQIGHNTHIGRHCIIIAQVGISGSCELGDFVVLGGQVGLADHVRIGDGSRIAAKGGAPPGNLPGGEDYGGVPVRPMKQWRRELAAVALLAKRRKRDRDG